jgi:hypothetical protein
MSVIPQYTRGASAYTQTGYQPTRRLPESGLLSEHTDDPVRTWSDVIDELLVFRKLEDDWDGQGALAPDPSVVDTALQVALKFRGGEQPPADRVVAGVNGTVFFEWFFPTQYMEIEVTAPGQVEVRLVCRESNKTEEFTLSL